VADYLEFAEMMALDALERDESCGGHFREEHQTRRARPSATTTRSATSAAWEYKGVGKPPPNLHKEPLEFEYVKLAQRSYK
jgi:succinate dehydrogenase / fumarate reductase flavoprotein subunit